MRSRLANHQHSNIAHNKRKHLNSRTCNLKIRIMIRYSRTSHPNSSKIGIVAHVHTSQIYIITATQITQRRIYRKIEPGNLRTATFRNPLQGNRKSDGGGRTFPKTGPEPIISWITSDPLSPSRTDGAGPAPSPSYCRRNRRSPRTTPVGRDRFYHTNAANR